MEHTEQKEQITVGKFSDYWLNAVMKISIRQTTYTAYKGFIENHIKNHFDSFPLSKLSAIDIQQFVSELTKRLSPKSVHLIMAVLKNIISYALEFGFIHQNPCNKIRMPKIIEKETKAFSRAEQQAIENTIGRSSDRRSLGVLICLYTGIRLGELCALKWEDVDFKTKCLKIKASLKRVYLYNDDIKEATPKTVCIEEEPKTKKSRRTIPLPEFLCDTLKTLKKDSAGSYIVSMKNGNYVKPRTMQLIYSQLLKQAKVPYSSFHTLRHTFASRAIELLGDIKTVSDILGHTNSMITLNRYAHSLTEQKRKLMSSFNQFFNRKTK